MSEILANDLRLQYQKAFSIIREIIETFPEDRWLKPHGDVYYIPCRIAYHLAVVIDGYLAGNSKDKDFVAKLPYGKWLEATAETLPQKSELLSYFDGAQSRAEKVLAGLTDEVLLAPIDPDRARMGSSWIGMYMQLLRELSDHAGELNKMLIEDGKPDIWR